MAVVRNVIWVLFFVISIALVAVVLMQEGKGGGLGSAFGGAGGEAFGHGVGGINKFTGILAAVWMALAVALAVIGNADDGAPQAG